MPDIEWECERSIRLARLAYLLSNGKLDADAAGDIIYECQPITGWYPLETLSVESVVEAARYYWSNPATDIEPLAKRACRRIWNKWSSTGDIASAAEDWAIDLIREYAAEEGAALVLVEGEREEAEAGL